MPRMSRRLAAVVEARRRTWRRQHRGCSELPTDSEPTTSKSTAEL